MGNAEGKSWLRGAFDKIESQIENQKAVKAENEDQYGQQTASHVFGSKRVAIYAGGYVQVREGFGLSSAPFERLLGIESQADVTKKSGFGRGAAAMATLGTNLLSSNIRGDVYLTIATDQQTHSLRTHPSTDSVRAAKALELAGKAVIAANAAQNSGIQNAQSLAQPDVTDQIRKLAELHAAGALTDQEFADKKAELLDRL